TGDGGRRLARCTHEKPSRERSSLPAGLVMNNAGLGGPRSPARGGHAARRRRAGSSPWAAGYALPQGLAPATFGAPYRVTSACAHTSTRLPSLSSHTATPLPSGPSAISGAMYDS